MFSFFSHTKEGSQSIILDIQSGLVRGALISERGGITTIKSVVTKSIPSKTHIINSVHLTKRILKLITEVVELLTKNTNRVSSIHYILSSPWVTTQLKTIKVDYKKETEITSRMLAELIQSELKHQAGDTMQVIEQKIFEIKLNGYITTAFEAKKARALEFSLATSFSPTSFLTKLHSAIHGVVNIRKATHNSALLMQYTALRDMLPDKHEYIYIHVHDELTDIVIVKNNLCKHISSFPFGISTLLRKLATATNHSHESSDSLLSLYQGKKLSEADWISTQKIITPLLEEWRDVCIKTFKTAFDVTSIPRSMYVAAHSHYDLFREALITQADLNLMIYPYDDLAKDDATIVYEKSSAQSAMIRMYTLALRSVL
jgi:cell division ATPase FtsA